ncbi:MAG: alpha/beta fold hydrolase [Chromatiaceae bacterium]|nr:alpha/beta fold hydrolase [Chromatiaceae bacterium]
MSAVKAWFAYTAVMTRRLWRIVLAVGIFWIVLAAILRWIAQPAPTSVDLDQHGGDRLVVLVHGLSGRAALQPTVELAAETLPDADLLTIAYDAHPLSNADVYAIANLLETEINNADRNANYRSIVLLGHSMGAMLVRKALLWGSGIEDDRESHKGVHPWVRKVERIVSLAGINRGWSITPRPEKMPWWRYASIWIGETVGRLTGTGQMLLAMQRGAPFVADSRVQWIRYARQQTASDGRSQKLPQVIHLLGDRDDIVSRADSQDLNVAKETLFVTLADTDHASIAEAVRGGSGPGAEKRRAAIASALRGDLTRLSPDLVQSAPEDPKVERVIYLMHGIRDYGGWTDQVRREIEARVQRDPSIAVVNKKYGYFPMLRFLLYWDRHKNVRRLMDEYTENLARFPRARQFDFAGHSNGTYLLASAMQHYRSISFGHVFFAGSVVPKHYAWKPLLDAGRVQEVVNVVADGDWVVAIFPKLFEQVADWLSVQPRTGVLDLGSAGFRGFEASADPLGRVHNLRFVHGGHGAGIDITDKAKLAAIVDYLVSGRLDRVRVFEDANEWVGWVDVASNVSWLVWIGLAALLLLLVSLAFMLHRFIGIAAVVLVLGALMSV